MWWNSDQIDKRVLPHRIGKIARVIYIHSFLAAKYGEGKIPRTKVKPNTGNLLISLLSTRQVALIVISILNILSLINFQLLPTI